MTTPLPWILCRVLEKRLIPGFPARPGRLEGRPREASLELISLISCSYLTTDTPKPQAHCQGEGPEDPINSMPLNKSFIHTCSVSRMEVNPKSAQMAQGPVVRCTGMRKGRGCC